MPQSANLRASASVDFPLPRAPMMQVKPRGILTFRPGRNPAADLDLLKHPHVFNLCRGGNRRYSLPSKAFRNWNRQFTLLYTRSWFVQAQNRLLSQTLRIAKAANNAFGRTLTSPWYWL